MINPLIVVFLIAYVYSLIIAPWLKRAYPKSRMNQMHEKCVTQATSAEKWMLRGRGKSYIIGGNEESSKLQSCLVTFWGASHFILYLIVGFLCPNKSLMFNTFGALFEVYEYYKYDCADPLDLLLNFSGYAVGSSIKGFNKSPF